MLGHYFVEWPEHDVLRDYHCTSYQDALERAQQWADETGRTVYIRNTVRTIGHVEPRRDTEGKLA